MGSIEVNMLNAKACRLAILQTVQRAYKNKRQISLTFWTSDMHIPPKDTPKRIKRAYAPLYKPLPKQRLSSSYGEHLQGTIIPGHSRSFIYKRDTEQNDPLRAFTGEE